MKLHGKQLQKMVIMSRIDSVHADQLVYLQVWAQLFETNDVVS